MRIVVLAYLEKDASKPDVVVEQVARALKEGGHEISTFSIHEDPTKLIAGLRRRKPELIFNLVESFGDYILGALMGVTGVLDLLELPYTGGGPGELYLQEDKALSKKLLAFDQIRSPDFAAFWPNAEFETGGNLRMPLFVKPLRMDASFGIDGKKSLVRSTQELLEQVASIHKEFNDGALAEEYIDGREFYVGILGNQDPTVFPPIEMDFSGLPEGAPKVMDGKAKFDKESPEYQGTKAVIAQLDDEMKAKLQKTALDAYRALRVRDYGRIDLRVSDTGEIYVIEVNASCYLERESEFAQSAAAAGIDYNTLVNRIAELAWERHSNRMKFTEPKRARKRRKKRQSGEAKPEGSKAKAEAENAA